MAIVICLTKSPYQVPLVDTESLRCRTSTVEAVIRQALELSVEACWPYTTFLVQFQGIDKRISNLRRAYCVAVVTGFRGRDVKNRRRWASWRESRQQTTKQHVASTNQKEAQDNRGYLCWWHQCLPWISFQLSSQNISRKISGVIAELFTLRLV